MIIPEINIRIIKTEVKASKSHLPGLGRQDVNYREKYYSVLIPNKEKNWSLKEKHFPD